MLRREGVALSTSSIVAACKVAIKHCVPNVIESELLAYLASRCNERLVGDNVSIPDATKAIMGVSGQ
eukprot:9784862-Lingulodinium_polyedra.AAC.1